MACDERETKPLTAKLAKHIREEREDKPSKPILKLICLMRCTRRIGRVLPEKYCGLRIWKIYDYSQLQFLP